MDKIIQATQLESLRNNEYFTNAVAQMKSSLVEQEDNLLRDVLMDEQKRLKAMERIALMRVLLADMVDTLDGIIQEGHNLQLEQEQRLGS